MTETPDKDFKHIDFFAAIGKGDMHTVRRVLVEYPEALDWENDFGLTPVLRLQPNNPAGFSPYAELGVGFHFLSSTSVSPQRQFGSSFQFGDHVGAGVRFGDKGQYDIGYRYQHLSNAGIKQPNQGINFQQLRLQYHF